MRSIILVTFFLTALVTIDAQQDEKLRSSWEIEVDPIAYILRGYSAHGIYQANHLRYDIGIFGIDQPEAYHGNKGFSLKSNGVGAKVTYLIKGIPGFYTGLGSGLAFHNAKNENSGEKADGSSVSIGIILGYRQFFRNLKSPGLKGIYITPWASFDYNYKIRKVSFTDYDFRMKTFSIFPTIHVGYRF